MKPLQNILQHKMLSKIFTQLIDKRQGVTFCLLLGVSCSIAFFHYHAGTNLNIPHYYDVMQLSYLFEEIFAHSASIFDYKLSRSPSFVPDYIFFFFAYILSPDVYNRLPTYSVIQIIAFALAMLFLSTQMKLQNNLSLLIVSLISIFVWLSIAHTDNRPFVYLLLSVFHFGIIILSILNIALWLKYQQSNNIRYFLAIIFICFAGAISDPLFLVQGVAPLAAIIILSSFFLKDNNIKKALILSFCVIVAGLLAHFLLPYTGIVSHTIPRKFAVNQIGKQFTETWQTIHDIVKGKNLYGLCLFGYIGIVGRMLYLFFLKPSQIQQQKPLFILTIYSVLSIAAAILIMLPYHRVVDRYFIPLFVFPIIITFFAMHHRLRFAQARIYICIFVSFSILSALPLLPKLKEGITIKNHLSDVICVDEALKNTSARNGISTIVGLGRFHFLTSDVTIAIYSREGSAQVIKHRFWALNNYRETYDFSITGHRLKEALLAINAPPKLIKECGGWALIVYENDSMKVPDFETQEKIN